jgi:hypothetical protein
MSAPESSLSAGQAHLAQAEELVADQQRLDEFEAAVAALQCAPMVLGQQTRLVEAVAVWLARWPVAADVMQAGLLGSAQLIEAAAQSYSRQDAATADGLSAVTVMLD